MSEDIMERLQSFPFTSVYNDYDDNGRPIYDRAVGSRMLRHAFAQFFSSGIFPQPSDNLMLRRGSGFDVVVSYGEAIIDGAFGGVDDVNGKAFTLMTEPPRGIKTYAFFVRLDDNFDKRSLYIRVAETAGSAPAEPEEVEGAVSELRLGYVTFPSNAASVEDATLVDERGLAVCPYAAPFEDIDVSHILDEVRRTAGMELDSFMRILSDNLSFIASAIDGTAAGNLQAQINQLNMDAVRRSNLDPRNLTASNTGLVRLAEGAADGTTVELTKDNAIGVRDGGISYEKLSNSAVKKILHGREPACFSTLVDVEKVNICMAGEQGQGRYSWPYIYTRENGSAMSFSSFIRNGSVKYCIYGTVKNGEFVEYSSSVSIGSYSFIINGPCVMQDEKDGTFRIKLYLFTINSVNKNSGWLIINILINDDGVVTASSSSVDDQTYREMFGLALFSATAYRTELYRGNQSPATCWVNNGVSHCIFVDAKKGNNTFVLASLTEDGVLSEDRVTVEGLPLPTSFYYKNSYMNISAHIIGDEAVATYADVDVGLTTGIRKITILKFDMKSRNIKKCVINYESNVGGDVQSGLFNVLRGGVIGELDSFSMIGMYDKKVVKRTLHVDFYNESHEIFDDFIVPYYNYEIDYISPNRDAYATGGLWFFGKESESIFQRANIIAKQEMTEVAFYDAILKPYELYYSESLTKYENINQFYNFTKSLINFSLINGIQEADGKVYVDGSSIMPSVTYVANIGDSNFVYNMRSIDVGKMEGILCG